MVFAANTFAGVIPAVPHIPAVALEPASPNDPAKIAERIAENAKNAGDRLAAADPGADTRKTQDQILKDIDELLKQNQNPPPMGGGGSSGESPPPPSGQSGGNPPPNGGNSGGSKSPMESASPPPGQGGSGGGSKSPSGKERGSWRNSPGKDRGETATAGKPEEPKAPGPMAAPPTQPNVGPGRPGEEKNAGTGGSPAKPQTALPNEDAVIKKAWGHLPEKLRQQMTQYYKEQYMPRYGDLLRQYYGSLAEREKPTAK